MSCTRSLICMSSGLGSTSFLMRFQRLDFGRLFAFCVASTALGAIAGVAETVAPVDGRSSCELFPAVTAAGDGLLLVLLGPEAPPLPVAAARIAARGCLESIPRVTSLDSRRDGRGELLLLAFAVGGLVLVAGSRATRGAAMAAIPGSIETSPVAIVGLLTERAV